MTKPSKTQRRSHRPFIRYSVAIFSVPLVILAAIIWTIVAPAPDHPDGDLAALSLGVHERSATSEAAPSWGGEALKAVYQGVAKSSPIRLANACGSGASSCFKCHDGRHAVAPKYDAKTDPWHLQHKMVEHDCYGCHRGNERIIKKEIAHVDMIVDPRTKSEVCTSCHKPDEVAKLLPGYNKIKKP
jgi:hypothetical protein